MLFRPVAAGLMIVTSLASANVARAEVTIVLSINLTGLDPGARFVQPHCVGFGAERHRLVIASGGLPFQPVTGGQFVQTVRFPMRRTEAAGGPVTEYACGVSVWGQRRDGVAYTFNTPAVAAFSRPSVTRRLSRAGWGMLGDSWSWPGDGPYTYRAVVAPIAKGPSPQYFSGGVFTPEQARALAVVDASPSAAAVITTESRRLGLENARALPPMAAGREPGERSAGTCPCGCGAGGPDGAACSPAEARAVWERLPPYEPTPPGGARRDPPPPSPSAPPPPAGRSPAGTPITVEAPPIFFRGTGDFMQYVP